MGVMFVDVAKYRWFGVIAAVSIILLVGALLLGFLGPSTFENEVDYAYNCPDDSHNWAPECTGVRLGEPYTTYYHELPQLEALNGHWSLVVVPYNNQVGENSVNDEYLYLEVNVFGRKSTSDQWETLISNQISEHPLWCATNVAPCLGFVLLYESRIEYPFYSVSISIPVTPESESGRAKIGDIGFQYQWYNASFIEEQMLMRVIFLVIATVVIFVCWVRMKKVPFDQWTIEQKALIALLLALIPLNNPFFPFEFLIPGQFFPILDCFFQTIHLCTLLLYWLFMFDFFRKQSNAFVNTDLLKIASVFIYGLVCVMFFSWFRISNQVDPVFGEVQSNAGLVILFFVAVLMFGVNIIAVLVFFMLGFPVAIHNRHLVPRFFMGAIPALVVISSNVGALFFGVFGPIQRTAPAFVYFYTLYNLYVWVLIVGYWPLLGSTFRQAQKKPDETFPIFAPSPDEVYGTDETL